MKYLVIVLGVLLFVSPVSADWLDDCIDGANKNYEYALKFQCKELKRATGKYQKQDCDLPDSTAKDIEEMKDAEMERCNMKYGQGGVDK